MKNKFRPKTTPTGFNPTNKSKVVKIPTVTGPPAHAVRAWLVKVAYVQERSRWESFKDGATVTYRPPRSYDGKKPVTIDGEVEMAPGKDSVWQRIVDWCDNRGIPPEQYIRAVFSDLPIDRKCAPDPPQILGPVYEDKWKKVSAKVPDRLAAALASEKALARTHLIVNQSLHGDTAEFAQRLVLADGNLDLSPLFRYCLAMSIGTKVMRKLARKFQAEAVLQFECYPQHYEKVWAKMLPDGFSAMAKRLYPAVLAKLGHGMKPDDPADDE